VGKQVKGNKKSLEDIKNEYGYNNFDESAIKLTLLNLYITLCVPWWKTTNNDISFQKCCLLVVYLLFFHCLFVVFCCGEICNYAFSNKRDRYTECD